MSHDTYEDMKYLQQSTHRMTKVSNQSQTKSKTVRKVYHLSQ